MIILELYGVESGWRTVDKYEYATLEEAEAQIMLARLSDSWVGHKIYKDITWKQFQDMPLAERNNLPWTGKFDKQAYVDAQENESIGRIVDSMVKLDRDLEAQEQNNERTEKK